MVGDNIQAVIETARSAVPAQTVAETPGFKTILIPGFGEQASRIEKVDLQAGLPKPLRKTGRVKVFDAASFNQVLADNADAGDIAIYLDRNPEKPSIVGVLNGHGAHGPGFGDFRAEIEFRPTPQWLKWKGIDGRLLPQATFAEFIEDNLEDVASPGKADMLEIATYLEVTRSVNFKSALRLSSGNVQFQNLESDDTKVGAGLIAIPETVTLGIAPIFGLPSYEVPARFRYRLVEGKLTLGIKLQRVETMMAQIVEDVIAKIERGANVSVMDGLPPS